MRPTSAIVDLDALAHNFRYLGQRLPPRCEVMPVVKADAYGHGAVAVARRLEREGARSFAVAVVEEGAELRRAGLEGEVLVLGWIGPEQLPELARHRLVANAHSLELLGELAAFASAQAVTLPVHLKLDTGMTRLGVRPGEIPEAARLIRDARGALRVEGVFQNFASADDPDGEQTAAQTACLRDCLTALAEHGLAAPMLHIANSAATLSSAGWPEGLPPVARVRPGLALYTRFPGFPPGDLRDVMSFRSVVDQVKRVPAGTRVGYGGTFVTRRPSTIAIVPAGYADGVPRSLSGRGEVLVQKRRCPIAGRVSMDLTAVDVTDLPVPPSRGEDVVFFGSAGGTRLGVEEVAEAAGTVSWEVLCGVGPRVPRVVVEDGERVQVISRFL